MTGGSHSSPAPDIKLPILNPGDYSAQDENITTQWDGRRDLILNKFGTHLNSPRAAPDGTEKEQEFGIESDLDSIEQSRILAHSNVPDSRKYQLLQQKGHFKQKQELIDIEKAKQSSNPASLNALSSKWFVNQMLEKHAKLRQFD